MGLASLIDLYKSKTEIEPECLFTYVGQGATSKQSISVSAFLGEPGTGIKFVVPNHKTTDKDKTSLIDIPARAEFVVNTLRNVVLGANGVRLCLVEHILAACALWGADDLILVVDGLEVPLDNGSAHIWIELFEKSGLARKTPACSIPLESPLFISKGDKQIIALPSDNFSITYMMDWPHPMIGKRWQTWQNGSAINDIADARTFGRQAEQEMLGLGDGGVSLTNDGFSKPLLFEDEPVRHKLLDLLGDLTLCGVNPLSIKAQFISIKAGHELDVQMAAKLQQALAVAK
jgi:UDP-3-O-[3-hydroxymyristoyl] N-acetylglucosamine deacetylase